jgi:hypothetical protein
MAAHLVYSFSSYHHRAQQRLWFVLSSISLCLFIPLFFEGISLGAKVAVAWVAICFEEFIWFFTYSPLAKKLLKAKYTTAVDIPHEVDRFAAFYILVLGEFLLKIMIGSPAAIGFNLGFMNAVWTLVIAFCLNWMYVHGSGALNQVHPLKHSVTHGYIWVFLHLPLVASLLAGGHAAAATAGYKKEYHHDEMWLLCGALGMGIIILWMIACLGECGDPPGTLILGKVCIPDSHSKAITNSPLQYYRLAVRPIVGIIICCLPLSHSLSINAMISIIMALFVATVLWENITSLQRGAKFWESWEGTEYPKTTDIISQGSAVDEGPFGDGDHHQLEETPSKGV